MEPPKGSGATICDRDGSPHVVSFPARDNSTGNKNPIDATDLPRRTATGRVRRQHLAQQVHELGPAPMLYLLEEIARVADLDERLERYAALPADFVREMGGDRFAPNVMSVRGGRA